MADASKFATDSVAAVVSDVGSRAGLVYAPVSLRVDVASPDGPLPASAWEDITWALWAGEPLTIRYGISGSAPQDLVAGSGTCQFTLSQYSLPGYFSPNAFASAIKPVGWQIGGLVRVSVVLAGGGDRVKFYGKLSSIRAEEGSHGSMLVRVIATDLMRDLSDAVLREFVGGLNISEVECLRLILGALPNQSVPLAGFDSAVDSFTLALDTVGAGSSGMSLVQDVMASTIGFYFQRGDAIHRYISRTSRTFYAPKDSFTVDDMAPDGLDAPSSIDDVYNDIIVERQNIVATVGLAVAGFESGTDTVGIPDGETSERWIEYSDPLDTANKPVSIAAVAFVTPVSGVDYVFNSASDGLGTDVTSSMVVRCDAFIGSAKFTVVNNSGGVAYRITLQVRAFAIVRRFKPVEFESYSAKYYGRRTLRMSLPFQSSGANAVYIASYTRGQYENDQQRVTGMRIVPDRSERLMRHAIEREPGDTISIYGPVTGLLADATIMSVDLSFQAGGPNGLMVGCRWGLGPAAGFSFAAPWALGSTGFAELGSGAILG